MAYKIQFDNGHTIEFDAQPTDKDIDEAYAHTQTFPKKQQPGFFQQLAADTGGTLAGLADVASGVVKAPLAIGQAIGGKLRGGSEYNTEELRHAGQAEIERLMPSFGATSGMEQNPGYKATMAPFEALGKLVQGLQDKASEATGNKDIGGAVGLGADIAGLGMGIPGAKYVGKGLAKVAETVDPGLRNAGKVAPKASVIDLGVSELLSPEVKPTVEATSQTRQPQITPMQSMAKELGGVEPFKAPEEFAPSPISRMAEQLPDFEMQSRGRAADEVAARRQAEMELEVKRQTSLDMGAAERSRREQAPTGFKEWQEAQDQASQQKRLERDSELAQRAGAGEQGGLFEPHMNMHRAYEEMFAKDENGVRPLSPREFKETLDNLSKEPGTAFQMPEDVSAAYKEYLNRTNEGQGDLFGAHEVLQSTSHKTWGELTSVERTKATKALKKIGPISENMVERMKSLAENKETGISYLRSGFSKEDMLKAAEKVYESGALKGVTSEYDRAALEAKYQNSSLVNNSIYGHRLREVGHAMIKTPEEAISLASKVGDVKQTNFVEKLIDKHTPLTTQGKLNTNLLTKGGTYLKGKINHPIVHFAIDMGLDAVAKANAKFSAIGHGMYLPAVRKLSNKEYVDFARLLEAADKGKKDITPEMMDTWGLSKNLREAIDIHQKAMKIAFEQENKALASLGLDPIAERPGYSAFNTIGDFKSVVRKGEDVVGVVSHDMKKSFEKIKRDLLANDPTLVFEDAPVGEGRPLRGSANEAFLQATARLGKDNPGTQELLALLKELGQKDPYTYMGMNKHTMGKKGVFGTEGRKPWLTPEENAKAMVENQVAYLESSIHCGEITEAVSKINDVIRDPEIAVKQPKAVEMAENYVHRLLGLDGSELGNAFDKAFGKGVAELGIGPSIPKTAMQKTKALTNALLLSFANLPFLAINFVQPLVGLPGHTAFLRGRDAAPMSTWATQGYGHFAQGLYTALKEVSGKGELSGIEKGALEYARTHEVYSTEMVERQKHTRADASYYSDRILQDPAALIELNSRKATYLGFVHMMHDAGILPEQGLYEQAQRATDAVMGHYGTHERAPLYNKLGPIGILAVNLVNFKHNELSRWATYARELTSHGNPAPIATQLAMAVTLAGIMGLPGSAEITSLFDYLTEKAGNPRSFELEVMDVSKKLAQSLNSDAYFALSHGILTKFGVDPSKRLGMPDVVPNTVADAAFGGGSKLYSAIGSVAAAIGTPDETHAKAAAYAAAPTSLQGILDRLWYEKDSMTLPKNPDKLAVPGVRRDATDKLWRSIGFAGIHETTQKTKDYQQDRLDQAYAAYRSSAMVKISQDLVQGKPVDDKTLTKYFVNGQGDEQTFIKDVESLQERQQITAEEAAILKRMGSSKIPQLQSLVRRTQ